MCGITGILQFSPLYDPDQLRHQIRSMLVPIKHRGPDDEGEWISKDGRVGFGHRRLSIIELGQAGHQPMFSDDLRYCITFNGEIYNYKELRKVLQEKGSHFRTETDTEVLLECFRHYGQDCVHHLDGMFAFAIYDTHTGELFAARDPFGEKPFYYFLDKDLFMFSSELSSMSGNPRISRFVPTEHLASYLCLQYFDGKKSIVNNLNKLEPGSAIFVDQSSRFMINRYYSFTPSLQKRKWDDPELIDELEDLLVRSIERRLRADVPVGAFLSGGVDSSLVVALATQKLNRSLKTFSIGFKGWDGSEHHDAEACARHLGTDHTTELLDVDCLAIEAEIARHIDEPLGDSSSIPTYLISRLARREVKVVVSGDGADELFGGYGRYFTTLAEEKIGQQALTAGERYYSSRAFVFTDQETEQLLSTTPNSFNHFLYKLHAEIDSSGLSVIDAIRKTDIEHYLPGDILVKVDRMSMLNSLEVRTPFLNLELAKFAASLPQPSLADGQGGKYLLKNLAQRYLPREWLDRPKRGFGIPPYQWGGGVLFDKVKQRFVDRADKSSWWIDSHKIDKWLSSYVQDKDVINHKLYTLLQVQNYMDLHGMLAVECLDSLKLRNLLKTLANSTKPRVLFAVHATQELQAILSTAVTIVALSIENDMPGVVVADWIKSPLDALHMARVHSGDRVTELIYLEYGRDAAVQHAVQLYNSGIRRCWVYEDLIWEKCEVANGYVPTNGIHHIPMLFDNRNKQSIWYRWNETMRDLREDVIGTLANFHSQTKNSGGLFEDSRGLFRRDTPARALALAREMKQWLNFSFYERRFLSSLIKYLEKRDQEFTGIKFDKVENITFFIGSLAQGGAERQLVNMASLLNERGYTVKVMTLFSGSKSAEYFEQVLRSRRISVIDASRSSHATGVNEIESKVPEDLVDILSVPIPLVRRQLWPAFTHILDNPTDLAICFLDGSNIIGGLASLLADVPRVITSFRSVNPTHFNFYETWYPKYYKALLSSRRVLLTGNSVVGINSYNHWLGLRPGQVKLLRNGLDLSHFDEIDPVKITRIRENFRIQPSDKLIGGVFRLSKEKRPHLFIDTVDWVRKTLPNVKAFILGGGSMMVEIREYVERKELSGAIFLLDAVEDVAPFLAVSDVILQTSNIEGTSNSIIEAQYMKKPVVVTVAGGASESLLNGESGYVCDSSEPESLGEKLIYILNNPEVAKAMGERGHTFVQSEYLLETAVSRLESLMLSSTH